MLMLGVAPEAAVLAALELEPGLVEVAAWFKLRLLPLDSLAPGAAPTVGGDPPAVVEAFWLEDVDMETLLCSRLPAAS